MKKLTLSIVLLILSLTVSAQSEKGDSIHVGRNLIVDAPSNIPIQDTNRDSLYCIYDYANGSFLDMPIITPVYPFGVANHGVNFYCPSQGNPNPGLIYQSNNFALSGMVNVTEYPGMMNKEEGQIGITIGNEKAYLQLNGIANKYAYYGGMIRQLGIAGQFTYVISSPLSVTAYGYYYGNNPLPRMPNGSFMPNSMLGYYEVSRFGGFVNYNASEHLGIQMGGQVVERLGPQNHYEFEPIFTPYINVGRKKKIGIGLPVGQFLYGIFGH